MDAFVKAAVLPPAPTVTVNTQSDESGIPLNWNSLDGASSYKVEVKGPTAASFSEAERTSSISFKYQTTVPGSFTFKVVPVVEFINKSDSIAEKFGSASEEKSGAVKLSDVAWIRLVMQTMMKGQGTIADRSTNFSNGGAETRYNSDKTVAFGARGYGTNGENDKYQVYQFIGYQDGNKAIKINGVLYHLYFTHHEGIFLTYSSQKWLNVYNDTSADGQDKEPGSITIDGTYPGEIRIWAKNNIAALKNDWTNATTNYINAAQGKTGVYIVGDYSECPDSMPECAEWIGEIASSWFSSGYGFQTAMSDNPGINTSTAYSIKRSGQSSFTNYNFSQVGALQ